MARDRKDKSTIDYFHRLEIDVIDKDWNIPCDYPDLSQYRQVAVDLETHDPRIKELGPGWCRKDGFIVGIAVAAGDYYTHALTEEGDLYSWGRGEYQVFGDGYAK